MASGGSAREEGSQVSTKMQSSAAGYNDPTKPYVCILPTTVMKYRHK